MECGFCVVLHLDKTNDRFMQLVNKHRLSHDLKGIPKKTQTLYKQDYMLYRSENTETVQLGFRLYPSQNTEIVQVGFRLYPSENKQIVQVGFKAIAI